MQLTEHQCQPCLKGSATLSSQDAERYLAHLPTWKIIAIDGEQRLLRQFTLKTYRQCLDFALGIGNLAEQQNHHPLMEIAWGEVTVSWWTHTIRGLHLNDFIMAARTDALYQAIDGN